MSPTTLGYLGERSINVEDRSVEFSCSNFDAIFVGFCFKLVSVLTDGTVRNRATQCVPTDSTLRKYIFCFLWRYTAGFISNVCMAVFFIFHFLNNQLLNGRKGNSD